MMKKLVCACCVGLLAGATHAATYTWDGEGGGASGANGAWSLATNWVGDVAPTFNNQADIVFYTTTSTDPTAGSYKNLRANRTVRSLTYNADADNTMSFTLSNGATGANNLTFDTDAVGGSAAVTVESGATGNHVIGGRTPQSTNIQGDIVLADNLLVTHNGSGTLTFGRAITGAYSVTKAGSGTMILDYQINSGEEVNAVGCYTGSTILTGGTLKLSANGSIAQSSDVQLGAGTTFDTTLRAFTMLAEQEFVFSVDASGAGSSGLLKADALDITAGVLNFTTIGTLDDAAYILADYTTLTGTTFSSVSSLPAGYTIDTNYLGGNQIALVAVIPEPATIGMLGLGALVTFMLRRRIRRG
jgi:hypothetical protein